MLIYHGGIEYIREPKVNVGRDGLDFGKGFYTTTMPQQAQKWAELSKHQPNQQICILNQTIVDKYLHFKEIM